MGGLPEWRSSGLGRLPGAIDKGVRQRAHINEIARIGRSGSVTITVVTGHSFPSLKVDEHGPLVDFGYVTFLALDLIRAGGCAAFLGFFGFWGALESANLQAHFPWRL